MGIQHPSFHQQQEGYNYGNSNKIGIEQSNKGYKCITVNKISHRYTTGNIIEGILEHSCFFSLIEKTRVFLRSKKGIPWYNQMFMDFVELQMGIFPNRLNIYIYRKIKQANNENTIWHIDNSWDPKRLMDPLQFKGLRVSHIGGKRLPRNEIVQHQKRPTSAVLQWFCNVFNYRKPQWVFLTSTIIISSWHQHKCLLPNNYRYSKVHQHFLPVEFHLYRVVPNS